METSGLPEEDALGPGDGWIITGSVTVEKAVISGPATATTVMTTGNSGLVAKGEGKLTAPVILAQNPHRRL